MNLVQKYKNWKNAENPAKISFHNIWKVIHSFYRRLFKKKLSNSFMEQIEYRKKVSNPECISTNICRCGCSWDELIWSDDSCLGNCFPPIMSTSEWETYKKIKNIKL